ncbi:MAG TPA: response regulator [Verrucomicrobiae bacterium]|jgi:DNA-binding NarL/FixJ family response regulator|nr:response regulator [Verrucomicrobiae bacterium]
MNTIKVLAIEDNPDDVELVKRALRGRDGEAFEITIESRLSDGLEALATDDKYDVVVLDVKLPDSKDLVDAVQRVGSARPGVAIVVMTPSVEEKTTLQVLRAGADDYLLKSEIGMAVLPRVIRYTVERRRAQAQLRRAEQLEMLNQLSAAAMHEFSNLALIIAGNADLLACPDEGADLPRIASIKVAVRRMTVLIHSLTNFTRGQSPGQLPRVDMVAALANVQKIIDRNSLDNSAKV